MAIAEIEIIVPERRHRGDAILAGKVNGPLNELDRRLIGRVIDIATEAHRGDVEVIDADINQRLREPEVAATAAVRQHLAGNERNFRGDSNDASAVDWRTDAGCAMRAVTILVIPRGRVRIASGTGRDKRAAACKIEVSLKI